MKKRSLVQGLSLTGLFVMLLIYGCTGKSTTTGNMDLAQNESQRNEAFNQIMQNRDMMHDFMNQVWQNQQAMHWMMQDTSFMGHMFNRENVSYMMDQNPSLMDAMMQNMASMLDSNQSYMQHWNSMMQQQGHMRAMMNQGQ